MSSVHKRKTTSSTAAKSTAAATTTTANNKSNKRNKQPPPQPVEEKISLPTPSSSKKKSNKVRIRANAKNKPEPQPIVDSEPELEPVPEAEPEPEPEPVLIEEDAVAGEESDQPSTIYSEDNYVDHLDPLPFDFQQETDDQPDDHQQPEPIELDEQEIAEEQLEFELEQQRRQHEHSQAHFMQQQYGMSASAAAASSSTASHHPLPSAMKKTKAGAVGVPAYEETAELTPQQKAFINEGLIRWQQLRKTWVSGNDASTPKSSKNSSSTSTSAAAANTGKTQLPHPISSHAHNKKLPPPTSKATSSEGELSEGEVGSDAFMADDASTDSDEDINLDVPRIIAARETYSVFEPRVKLSHMVDILNVVWEEESD